jgi:hypothetical protein
MVATNGAIGGSDTGNTADNNTNAIDTSVSTLASAAGSGIYIRELDGLAIDEVVVNYFRTNFNSTFTSLSVRGEDLTTTNNGPIKIQAVSGNITVAAGPNGGSGISANGSGDILLQTLGNNGDIIVNATVGSTSGHVTLNATDDVLVNSAISTGGAGSVLINALNNSTDAAGLVVDGVNLNGALTTNNGDILVQSTQDLRQTAAIFSTTGDIGIVSQNNIEQTAAGDITTVGGDVLIDAVNGTWAMANGTIISVGGSDFVGQANGDIALGEIVMTNATTNRVGIQSLTGSITDANGTASNVSESIAGATTSLSLRAADLIGPSGIFQDDIDLNVDIVAAQAQNGIFLTEVEAGGDLVVGNASAATVSVNGMKQSRFNSSTTDVLPVTRLLDRLEDLRTMNNGTIQALTENGTLRITGGTDDVGIVAGGTADIFLAGFNTTGSGGDVVIDGSVQTGSGQIGILAADDIRTSQTVSINGPGNINLLALNNRNDSTPTLNDGISLGASVIAAAGDLTFESAGDIDTTNSNVVIVGRDLVIDSIGYTHLNRTQVATLQARVEGVGGLDRSFEQTNPLANAKGDDFFGGMNPLNATEGNLLPAQSGTNFESNANAASGNYLFQNRTAEQYALFIKNSGDLTIRSIVAESTTAPHVYVETTDSRDITVDGLVVTVNTQANNTPNATEGLIVFVAGGEFEMTNNGAMITAANFSGGVRVQSINQIGADGDYVMVTGYDGGQGANGVLPVSTRIVNPDLFNSNALDNDPEIDAFQRVVLNYGAPGERGFDVYISYADGFLQRFHNASDLGVVSDATFVPGSQILDTDSYASAPLGSPVNAFTRTTPFSQTFIVDNSSLPTVVSVRRADDFFIFENASATNAGDIRDLTVERVEILDVVSITAEQRPLPLPQDARIFIPPIILSIPAPEESINVLLPNTSMELTEVSERQIVIGIYQVYFEDTDNDGYADEEELPADSEIIDFAVIDEEDNKDKKQLDPKTRLKKGAVSAATGSITNQEIEAIKADFLKNPNQPAGAYAIIKKDFFNNESVLEVFAVRDDQRESEANQENSPIIQKKLVPSEDAPSPDEPAATTPDDPNDAPQPIKQPQPNTLSHSTTHSTLGVETEMLAGALWLLQRKPKDANSLLESIGTEDGKSIRVNRSARRARRIASFFGNTISNN